MMLLLIVTLTSLLLAAIMSVIAWRIAGDERRRSDARVAALAAEIHAPQPGGVPPWRRVRQEPGYSNLFVPQASTGSRPVAVLAGGALAFAAVVALAIGAGGGFIRLSRGARAVAPAAPAALPLELVALGDERVGDQLTVRGVVRNPPSGSGVDGLPAVVLLFKPDGELLTTGRAMLDAPALQPGRESAFAVTVPRALDAGRYRVSFRADDHVVPHRDRRHES